MEFISIGMKTVLIPSAVVSWVLVEEVEVREICGGASRLLRHISSCDGYADELYST